MSVLHFFRALPFFRTISLTVIPLWLLLWSPLCWAEPEALRYLDVLGADLPLLSDADLRALQVKRSASRESHDRRVPNEEEFLLREILLIKGESETLESFQGRIGEVSDRLSARPEDFGAIAREVSESSTRRKGGLLTPSTLNQLEPEYREAVRSLRIGQCTGAIIRGEGSPGRQTATFFRREEIHQQERVLE